MTSTKHVSFLDSMMAMAVAEMRSTQRSISVWLLVALGFAVTLIAFGYFSHAHIMVSGQLLSGGHTGPRYLFSYFAPYFLWCIQIGLVFVAVDVCSQDKRDRIAEVLDSRPVANSALLAGRTVGLVLTGWLPLAVASIAMQSIGMVARAADWPVGDLIEPVSLAGFLLVFAVPLLFLWCALLVCLVIVLRNRLIAGLAGLGLLGAQMWCYANVPAYLLPMVAPASGGGFWASDIVPQFADTVASVECASLMLVGAALLGFSGAVHRRRDGSHGSQWIAAIGLAAAGLGGVGWVFLDSFSDVRLRTSWLATHTAAERAATAFPDVEHVVGDVRIMPGDLLVLDIDIVVRTPQRDRGELLFSLNPGMRVEHVRLDETKTGYRHADGLLSIDVPMSLRPASRLTISLRASGMPDARFAYLDSPVDWRLEPRANRLGLLGSEGGIYDKRYVALMPGLRWLPTPGANLERGMRDYFTADLTVEVPADWWVAGADAPREDVQEPTSGRRRFRLSTTAVVPDVGIVAGPFERRAAQVGGVELELLVHPAHSGNVELLAEAVGSAILDRVEELLADAARLGLPYPYSSLTLVEAPSRLRGYDGGWRMDTTLALPGILLFKEHGFPNARLDTILANLEGRPKKEIARYVEAYFDYDYTDGRLLPGFAKNLLSYQVGVAGNGRAALDFILHELAIQVLQETRPPRVNVFSAHAFDYEVYFGAAIGEAFDGLFRGSLFPVLGTFRPDLERSSVWELALNNALQDLDVHRNPRAATYALMRRGGALARGLVDSMGRERTAALLAGLRQRHVGGHIDVEGFLAAARDIGSDIAFVEPWIKSARAPGFRVSPATVVKLGDDNVGGSTHHVRLHVRNNEPVAGLVRLGTSMFSMEGSEPVVIGGNTSLQIGMVMQEPPAQLYLLPYLSLNRNAVKLELPSHVETVVSEAYRGTEPSAWLPAPEGGIVVDDLDPGFSSRHSTGGTRFGRTIRRLLGSRETAGDRELPEYPRWKGDWARLGFPSAWGMYHRTVAWALPGNGNETVSFQAQLPERAQWRLEYYLPDRHVPNALGTFFGNLGAFDMKLVGVGDADVPIDFDGSAAQAGWNTLGTFMTGPGATSLVVTNRTTGDLTVADAIRWSQVDSS